MATNSPRLGLTLPEEGDYLDDGVMSGNFAKLDAQAGTVVCTSTTRPSSPYQGMLIFETDTRNMRVRVGTSWALVSDTSTTWETITNITYSTGWAAEGTPVYQKYGSEVYIVIQVKATAVHTYNATAGTITNAELCIIGPDDILPSQNFGYALMGGNTRVSSASIVGKAAGPTLKGRVGVNSVAGTADVSVGNILRVFGSYPII